MEATLEIGKRYYLIGPDGKRTLNKFELLELDAQGRTRVRGTDGTKFRVHSNRVVQGTFTKERDMSPEVKAPKAPEAPKVEKVVEKIPPFDVAGFVAGREHWVKEGAKFDHAAYKLDVHCVIDEKTGRYFLVNTYRYPSGVVSLGRSNAGLTEYPLKGHKVTYTVSQKAARVEARGTKKQRKGTKTPDEIRAALTKKGYKKVS